MAAARAAPSFNAAAHGLAECDCGTAAHSAASSDATADAYRFAARYSGAALVGCSSLSD